MEVEPLSKLPKEIPAGIIDRCVCIAEIDGHQWATNGKVIIRVDAIKSSAKKRYTNKPSHDSSERIKNMLKTYFNKIKTRPRIKLTACAFVPFPNDIAGWLLVERGDKPYKKAWWNLNLYRRVAQDLKGCTGLESVADVKRYSDNLLLFVRNEELLAVLLPVTIPSQYHGKKNELKSW